MLYDFSPSFTKTDDFNSDFSIIWKKFCQELLAGVFPSNSIILMDVNKYGIDIYDQSTSTAYCCHTVDEPNNNSIPVDHTIELFENAVRNRKQLKWNKYNICSNAIYSDEGIKNVFERIKELEIDSEDVGFLGPSTWNRLSDENPRIVANWFNYKIKISNDTVKKSFEQARYFPNYVAEYLNKITEANFFVVLSNNRTPLQFEIPFSPELTIEQLLDIGKVLFDLSLDKVEFHDLSTSAQLNLSVIINGVQQSFSKKLSEVPLQNGGDAQIWIKIVWQEETFTEKDPVDNLPIRNFLKSNKLFHLYDIAYCHNNFLETTNFILTKSIKVPILSQQRTTSKKDDTIARKVSIVCSRIWQKSKELMPTERLVFLRSKVPVRLGVSAPKAVQPSSSFSARFIAYHPDLEELVTKQLDNWNPEASHKLDTVRTNWKLNTIVKVKAHGENLIIEPGCDEFIWEGTKNILDFKAKISNDNAEECDIKFDVYIKDIRVSRLWFPIKISDSSDREIQSKTISSPRTAFASYSSEDRPRVLDRVATLEIHCGLQVFLDCVSMRPNAKWRELLPEMVIDSDQLLLFWSKEAKESIWVNKEWRIAFDKKGIDGIEIHPLSPYNEAPLPKELADLAHGADPLMVLRDHEVKVRKKKAKT